MRQTKPVALVILDGWGIAPDSGGNAVTRARTPFINSLFTAYPHSRLDCFGPAVGLPEGQMGNSEVGHLNLGAGRVVHQDIARINNAINNGELAANPAIKKALAKVKESGGVLHFMGLVSDGGVHSLLTHLYALVELAAKKGLSKIAVHAFLDGRDTPPDSGAGYLAQLEEHLAKIPGAFIASVGGRYWGMDRDKRWDRVAKAYNAMVRGQGPTASDAVSYVKASYKAEVFDEFIEHCVLSDDTGAPKALVSDGDAVIFFNFRADRAREMTWALNQPGFDGFDASPRPELADYVCMTQYDEHLDVPVAFPPERICDTLAETVSLAGLKQLHIAETEKYAHVTFFFNGGREEPFANEDRILVPSPSDVATYDEKPAMSAPKVTGKVLEAINNGDYDLIVMNYANCDMVGHTGVFEAARQAVEVLDGCLSRVVPAVLEKGGRLLITADHGNAEQMIDQKTGGPYTAHTVKNPVPVILVDPARRNVKLNDGVLADVSPTILGLMELPQPEAMTGTCLFKNQ